MSPDKKTVFHFQHCLQGEEAFLSLFFVLRMVCLNTLLKMAVAVSGIICKQNHTWLMRTSASCVSFHWLEKYFEEPSSKLHFRLNWPNWITYPCPLCNGLWENEFLVYLFFVVGDIFSSSERGNNSLSQISCLLYTWSHSPNG